MSVVLQAMTHVVLVFAFESWPQLFTEVWSQNNIIHELCQYGKNPSSRRINIIANHSYGFALPIYLSRQGLIAKMICSVHMWNIKAESCQALLCHNSVIHNYVAVGKILKRRGNWFHLKNQVTLRLFVPLCK